MATARARSIEPFTAVDALPGTPAHRTARPPLRLVPGGPEAALRRRQAPEVYRRRRLLVLALLVTALAGLLTAGQALEDHLVDRSPDPVAAATGDGAVAPAPASADATSADADQTYVVQPGDTLWSIARDLEVSGDVRAVVDRLAAQLDGATLQPGQRLDLAQVRR